jgi:hypothetical protein
MNGTSQLPELPVFKSPIDWRSFYVVVAIFLAFYASLGPSVTKKLNQIKQFNNQYERDLGKVSTELTRISASLSKPCAANGHA